MQPSPLKCFHISQLIVLTSLFSFGCGIKGTNGSCSTTGSAQITVNDSVISRDCGCAEGAGTFVSGSSNFVCTIKQNTNLFINYNTNVDHYITFGSYAIIPQTYTVGESATSGAVNFPSTSSGINFSDTGSGVSGTFVVTTN